MMTRRAGSPGRRGRAHAKLLPVAAALLAVCAVATGALAQTPEDPEGADATEVTPDEQRDLELPTERQTAQNPDDAGVPARDPENTAGDFGEPEEVGAQDFIVSMGVILGVIAISLVALMAIAYAAYQRGGERS